MTIELLVLWYDYVSANTDMCWTFPQVNLRREQDIRPEGMPVAIPPKGLTAERQWYLFDNIREFCVSAAKDITCPKPTVPRPKKTGKQSGTQ